MNKNRTVMLALIGAGLAAGGQTQAQSTFSTSGSYNEQDLILSFRNTAGGGNDVSVDLGNVGAFISSLEPGTTVLNNGANNGYTPLFTEAELSGVFGAATSGNVIGFSAAASDANSTENTWITQLQSTTAKNATGPHAINDNGVFAVDGALSSIAAAATDGSSTSLDASGAIMKVPASDANSYQQAATFLGGNTINYGGGESLVNGPVETPSTGGAVYAGLWEEPVDGTASQDQYLGYFTFNGASDQVSFTVPSAVPEPSTYALFAATGLLGLALRRQLRSLTA